MIMAFRPHYFSGVYPAGICHSIVPTFCAFAPLLLMLADASASTLDASSPLLLMLADAWASTLDASAPHLPMLADATASTLDASSPLLLMLADASASTLDTYAPHLLMLADATASTLDASSPLLLMLAPEGEEKMMDRRSRTDVTDYDRRRSIRRLSQKGCRGDACTSLFLRGGILYVI